jgi:hypothetical protein
VSVYERLEAPNIALPKLTPPVARPDMGRSVGCESNDRAREKRRTRPGHRSDGHTSSGGGSPKPDQTYLEALMVLMNSTPAYTEQHLVANGASEFFAEICGEIGMHVRCAGALWKF